MVGLSERRGGYLRGAATEHKTKEPLGCLVNVAGKCQTFIERGVSGPQDYRMPIHMVLLRRTARASPAKVCVARGTTMNDSDAARAGQLRSGQTDPPFVRCMRLLCRRLLRSFTLRSSPARARRRFTRGGRETMSFNLRPEEPAYVRGL